MLWWAKMKSLAHFLAVLLQSQECFNKKQLDNKRGTAAPNKWAQIYKDNSEKQRERDRERKKRRKFKFSNHDDFSSLIFSFFTWLSAFNVQHPFFIALQLEN